MKITDVSSIGAFAEWGLMKDLFIPFREQKKKLEPGKWAAIAVYIDLETNRIAGSAKVEKFLDNTPPTYKTGEKVNLMILSKSDLGYKVIINNIHTGLLYNNEIFKPLIPGERYSGYIKKVRSDEKIDCSLTAPGHEKTGDLSQLILNELDDNGGYLPICDKSDPELIYSTFGCSKKAFKMTIGTLYKEGKIVIEKNCIRLK